MDCSPQLCPSYCLSKSITYGLQPTRQYTIVDVFIFGMTLLLVQVSFLWAAVHNFVLVTVCPSQLPVGCSPQDSTQQLVSSFLVLGFYLSKSDFYGLQPITLSQLLFVQANYLWVAVHKTLHNSWCFHLWYAAITCPSHYFMGCSPQLRPSFCLSMSSFCGLQPTRYYIIVGVFIYGMRLLLVQVSFLWAAARNFVLGIVCPSQVIAAIIKI